MDIREVFPGVRSGEPLARFTTFRIGGPADYLAEVGTLEQLQRLRRWTAASGMPVFFLGAGSNVLISDRGVRGLVIHLQGDFKRIAFEGTRVTAGAGAMMPQLAQQAASHGLSGVEALIGVPGTVGGGLVMNAGTREGWIGDVARSVDILDEAGEPRTLSAAELTFGYRSSNLAGAWVMGAVLELKPSDPATVKSKMQALLDYRAKTQPLATSNCGSVFKNPPQGAAAQWIEKAGLKGFAIGGARVSERHANFIINERQAGAGDVWALIQHIQAAVRERFGVALEPEVKQVGEW